MLLLALLSSCGGFSAAVTPGDRNEALQPEAGQKTFYYTGHAERFVVPSGVTTIEVDAIGAAGGGIRYPKYCYGPGFGRGGRIEAGDSRKAWGDALRSRGRRVCARPRETLAASTEAAPAATVATGG